MRANERSWLESVFKAGANGDRPDWAVVEWYAQDRYGRLGVFEAVGQPILRATFSDLNVYLAVKEAVYQLPRVTTAMVFKEGTCQQTAWCRELAERGLYIFASWEGSDWQKGYRLEASPEVPLRAEQLPALPSEWFSRLCLKRADFELAKVHALDLSGKGMDWVGLEQSASIDRSRRP